MAAVFNIEKFYANDARMYGLDAVFLYVNVSVSADMKLENFTPFLFT